MLAIGSLYNAWAAFRATSDNTFTRTAPEGTSLNFCLGWVSVCAQRLPVGSDPATFLVQSLLSCTPYYRQMSFSVKAVICPSDNNCHRGIPPGSLAPTVLLVPLVLGEWRGWGEATSGFLVAWQSAL